MTTLKIAAVSGHGNPKIYANGRNKVALEIQLQGVDKDNKPVNIAPGDWLSNLYLCFAEDGNSGLPWYGNKCWCVDSDPGPYAREIGSAAIPAPSEVGDGQQPVILYVSTDDVNTKRIAVGVNLPNGKNFNTSDVPSGAQKSAVQVTSAAPYQYTPENLNIQTPKDWVNNATSLERRSQVYTGEPWTTDNCVVRHKKSSISLGNDYQIAHKEVKSSGVPSNYIELQWFHESSNVAAIKLTNDGGGGYLNGWYVEPTKDFEMGFAWSLNGGYLNMDQSGWPSFYFAGEKSGAYDYGCWVYWPHYPIDKRVTSPAETSDSEIAVYCYQLHIPNSSELYWGKHCKPSGGHIEDPAKVYFIDNYGNECNVTITFGDETDGSFSVTTD